MRDLLLTAALLFAGCESRPKPIRTLWFCSCEKAPHCMTMSGLFAACVESSVCAETRDDALLSALPYRCSEGGDNCGCDCKTDGRVCGPK